MDIIIDNKETEENLQNLLKAVRLRKNPGVADLMKKKGIEYHVNLGVSIPELHEIANKFRKDHLLALKLWNKKWRETMILASLVDDPGKVSEEQMDFWTKSIKNTEIAEQLNSNLWVSTKFAFIKALEWCRGRKHIVRYAGIHLAGRLAITEKNALDEMFEPFFEEFNYLAKDILLFGVLYRSLVAFGNRSDDMRKLTLKFSRDIQTVDSENALKLGEIVYKDVELQ